VHWSVKERLGRLSLVDQSKYAKYAPKNLIDPVYTEKGETEKRFIALCHDNFTHEKREDCALYCNLGQLDQGWLKGLLRLRRLRRVRESWKDTLVTKG
jgi:hypothetical protein